MAVNAIEQRVRRCFLMTTTLTMLAAAPAFAQDAVPTAQGASASGSPASRGQGDIVVTAQKRSERLLSVPLPVTAIAPATLLAEGRAQLQDYFDKIPGLSLLSSGSGQFTLAVRGISTSSSSNPTVGIVIDDVPFGASSVTSYSSRLIPDLDPSDLAQVEVLRGPQGTLYGASSMGGLVKYVTVDPSTRGVFGQVQANLISVDGGGVGGGLRGAINVPLDEQLAVRVSGFGRRDPGYVDNATTGKDDVNSADAYGGRVSLLWHPDANIAWKVSALLQNIDGNGTSEVDSNSLFQTNSSDLTQTRLPGTGQYRSRVRLYSSTITADLSGFRLTALTGYGQSKYNAIYDYSPAYGVYSALFSGNPAATGATFHNIYNTRKFTQEVRVDRSIGDLIDFTVGGYYGRERTKGQQIINGVLQSADQIALNLATIRSHTNLDELAAFGDVTLHLGAFALQAGGRYAHNTQSYPRTAAGVLVAPGTTDIRSKSSLGTFVVSPQYKFSDNAMLYARIASGYRIGGPNPNAADGAPASYAPDKTVNYEFGFKGSFWDRLLTIDTSLFYIDWRNIQLSLSNPTSGLTYFTNGPRAKSEGVEAAITLQPTTGLTIAANGTYNVAELIRDLPAGGGAGRDGDRLPFSSRFAGNIAIDQAIPLNETTSATFGGTVTYVGARYSDFQRTFSLLRPRYPAYTTFDLRAGLKQGAWSVNAFLTNVSNRRGAIGGATRSLQSLATAPFGAVYIRPRTVGLSLGRSF